MSQELPSPAL